MNIGYSKQAAVKWNSGLRLAVPSYGGSIAPEHDLLENGTRFSQIL
jgi:hypothetical protein